MIIWISSYPKSGNTWVRSFISTLLFSKDGEANLNNIKKTYQFPLRSHFKNILDDFHSLKKISENWIKSQEIINLDSKVRFIKTHHAFCNVNGNNFTNLQNTLGVIYIIRDPRNVITSILHHYSKKNYLEAKEFIFDEKRIIGITLEKKKNYKDNEFLTLISSWKTHYNSWKKFPRNFYLIKYEDLLKNPEQEFEKLTYYLSKLLKLKFKKKIVRKAVESNSFENLKRLEELDGFAEAAQNVITGNKNKFFNLGPKNKWQNLLDTQTKNEIELKFKKEMIELKYL